MQIIMENPVHLIADDNMILTDGETYSTEVWLGKDASPSNWHEAPLEEVEDNGESTAYSLPF